MTMTYAQIMTPWIGTGTPDDPIRPQLGDDYPVAGDGSSIFGWNDISDGAATPNDGNSYLVEVTVLDTVLGSDLVAQPVSPITSVPVLGGESDGSGMTTEPGAIPTSIAQNGTYTIVTSNPIVTD